MTKPLEIIISRDFVVLLFLDFLECGVQKQEKCLTEYLLRLKLIHTGRLSSWMFCLCLCPCICLVCVFVVVFVISRWTLVLSSFQRCMICGWQCWNRLNVAVYRWSAYSGMMMMKMEMKMMKTTVKLRPVPDGSDNNLHNCQPVHGEWWCKSKQYSSFHLNNLW